MFRSQRQLILQILLSTFLTSVFVILVQENANAYQNIFVARSLLDSSTITNSHNIEKHPETNEISGVQYTLIPSYLRNLKQLRQRRLKYASNYWSHNYITLTMFAITNTASSSDLNHDDDDSIKAKNLVVTDSRSDDCKNSHRFSQETFPFVDPSIGKILLLCTGKTSRTCHEQQNWQYFQLDCEKSHENRIKIIFRPNPKCKNSNSPSTPTKSVVEPKDLIPLAIECDKFIFAQQINSVDDSTDHFFLFSQITKSLIDFAQTMVQPINNSTPEYSCSHCTCDDTHCYQKRHGSHSNVYVTIATILALNALESTIRNHTTNVHSLHDETENQRLNYRGDQSRLHGAPLLKHMIEQILDSSIKAILQCLLLPKGLNLRNLLWHGFIGSNLPRPWLSLVLVLIHLIEQLHDQEKSTDKTSISDSGRNNQKQKHDSHDSSRVLGNSCMIAKISGIATSKNLLSLKSDHPRLTYIVEQGEKICERLANTSAGVRQIQYVQNHNATTTCSASPARESFFSNSANDSIRQYVIPSSHWPLWDFCMCEIVSNYQCRNNSLTVIASIILTILLEHSLRIQYCQININRKDDLLARHGYFYITLDGHGQRHQHDLLLHPYQLHCDDHRKTVTESDQLTSKCQIESRKSDFIPDSCDLVKNGLIEKLGPSTVALLTDLFISGTGGPNLRSNMAHGAWDEFIQRELFFKCRVRDKSEVTNNPDINEDWQLEDSASDVVNVLLVAFDQLAGAVMSMSKDIGEDHESFLSSCRLTYRPIFSFTACTIKNLQQSFVAIKKLHSYECHQQFNSEELTNVPESVQNRVLSIVTISQLETRKQTLLNVLDRNRLERKLTFCAEERNERWTAEDVFFEHETNKLLESLGATRTLLADIAHATNSFLMDIQQTQDFSRQSSTDNTLEENQRCSLSSRQRSRMRRVVACYSFALDMYSFAYFVAILSLELVCKDMTAATAARMGDSENDLLLLNAKEMIQLVERTRMAVSTVENFMVKNVVRSFKAAEQYSKGKIVKKILSSCSTHGSKH